MKWTFSKPGGEPMCKTMEPASLRKCHHGLKPALRDCCSLEFIWGQKHPHSVKTHIARRGTWGALLILITCRLIVLYHVTPGMQTNSLSFRRSLTVHTNPYPSLDASVFLSASCSRPGWLLSGVPSILVNYKFWSFHDSGSIIHWVNSQNSGKHHTFDQFYCKGYT